MKTTGWTSGLADENSKCKRTTIEGMTSKKEQTKKEMEKKLREQEKMGDRKAGFDNVSKQIGINS